MSILITNVMQYAGPGALPVLLREHDEIFCHDRLFSNPALARQFMLEHPKAVALFAQSPKEIVDSIRSLGGIIDAVIHNDVHPNSPMLIEDTPIEAYQLAFDALVVFPIALTQLLLPRMKQERTGCFVFVTSARCRQPEAGFSVATSIRSATTSFALALAREVAPNGIQVNVVEPNYLYSEAYYPKVRFIDNPSGRAEIAAKVPLGRLGRPEEIGELLTFLVSRRSPFVTGQVIGFTGGWP